MKKDHRTKDQLLAENEDLRRRLEEAEETLQAIRRGEVDAVVISGPEGEQVFTLKGAEYPYRILLETMNEGAVTITADGNIMYCNNRFARMIQMPPPQVINSSIYDVISPADRKLFDGILKERGRGEISLRVKDETRIPVYLSCTSLELEDTPSICMVVTDLTEQKRNEEILKAERLSRSILDQATEAIIVCNENGQITRASQMAHELCDKNLLLQHFDEIFSLWVNRGGTLQDQFSIATPLKGEFVNSVGVGFRRDDGKVFDLLLSARPLLDQQNSIQGCVVTLVDITERKRAEEETQRLLNAVQQERDRLSALVNSIADEIWFADTEKKFTLANPSALREFGFDSADGVDVEKLAESLEVYRPDGSPRPIDEAPPLRALQGERVRNQEEIIRTPATGELRYRQVSAAPVRDSADKIIGSVSVVRDITERTRMEEELRQSRDELEMRVQERTQELQHSKELLQHLSSQLMSAQEAERKRIAAELHDSICASLAAIKLSLEKKLRQMKEGFSPSVVKLEDIITTVQQCNEETRKIMNNLRPGMLDDLGLLPTIHWYCKEFQKMDPHLTIQQEIHLSEEHLPDPIKIVIYRVMQEALNNAAKHSRADTVLISLMKEESRIKMVIQDNGQGFDLEKAAAEIRGMGLINMRERVQLSGGSYSLNSSKGEGTTMCASWPIAR